MWPPKLMSWNDANGSPLICKVYGALYGHQESGRKWQQFLHSTITREDSVQLKADPSALIKWKQNNFCILLIVTDGILIKSNYEKFMAANKTLLLSIFNGMDLGEVKEFNNLEIKRTNSGLSLSLRK